MKRIPLFAGLALAVVLATVTFLVRPTQALNDPCYDTCNDASQRIGEMLGECYSHSNATFNSSCTDAADGHAGGYSYSCSWMNCYYQNGWQCSGGGFGGGATIDPTNAACLP